MFGGEVCECGSAHVLRLHRLGPDLRSVGAQRLRHAAPLSKQAPPSSRANTPAQVATRAERVGAVIEPNADPRHRKTTFELVGDTDEQQSLGIALRCTSTGLSHRPRVARAARACHPQLRVIRARFGMSDSVERSGRKTHTVEKRPAAAGGAPQADPPAAKSTAREAQAIQKAELRRALNRVEEPEGKSGAGRQLHAPGDRQLVDMTECFTWKALKDLKYGSDGA